MIDANLSEKKNGLFFFYVTYYNFIALLRDRTIIKNKYEPLKNYIVSFIFFLFAFRYNCQVFNINIYKLSYTY